jgi:hypothetical protein
VRPADAGGARLQVSTALSERGASVAVGPGPGLQLFDLGVASGTGDDALGTGVVNAVDGAERYAQAAVDTVLDYDGEAAQKVILDTKNGVHFAGAGVIARPAADAGLVDVEVAKTVRHLYSANVVRKLPQALTNSCKLWL